MSSETAEGIKTLAIIYSAIVSSFALFLNIYNYVSENANRAKIKATFKISLMTDCA